MAGEFAVLCGGGAQGAAVVRALRRRGAPVRVLGRDAGRVHAAFGHEVAFAPADLDRPDSIAAALAGCVGVFAMLPIAPGFALAQARAGALLRALAAARAPRLVYSTGGFAVPGLAASGYVQGNLAMVDGVRGLGLPALVLRPAIYLDNLLWTDLTTALRGEGILAYPPLPAERRLSWTAHDDQGEAAAAALTAGVFPTGAYDVVAHGAPTQRELAALLAEVLGREVVHRPATPEAFGAALGATLGSAEIGAGIAQMYAAVAAAAPDAAVLDPAPLERAVGVRMASVPDWLRRNFR
ncbi:MAG: NmrA family NAD(P)-binding protein [Xanthomonadaceae bacterium]|nr:NmrA family NAD(P)-binding protein [Xanthomonadaceae bacterium]